MPQLIEPLLAQSEIDDLPEEAGAAFVALVDILNSRIDERSSNSEPWSDDFIALIQAFIHEYDVPSAGWMLEPFPTDTDSYHQRLDQFLGEIKRIYSSFRFRSSRLNGEQLSISIPLTEDYRKKIHEHLEKIREVVRTSDISNEKKERLFKQINNLSREADREITSAKAALAIMMEVSSAVGESAESLKPVFDRAKDIVEIFGLAKEQSLQRLLEGPRKMLPPPQKPADLDDEIPF